jgi:hypothetical protein
LRRNGKKGAAKHGFLASPSLLTPDGSGKRTYRQADRRHSFLAKP